MIKNTKADRKSWLYYIRINPDHDPDADFDLDVETAKIYNYIKDSFIKLVVDSVEKSLKEKIAKELLS